MKEITTLYLYEHFGNEHIFVRKFSSPKEAVEFVNKQYSLNTRVEDLIYALESFFTAWIYKDFYEISLELEKRY